MSTSRAEISTSGRHTGILAQHKLATRRTAARTRRSCRLASFPPILLQVGANELFLDDSVRLAERARQADVDVILDITAGALRVFQAFAATLDEATRRSTLTAYRLDRAAAQPPARPVGSVSVSFAPVQGRLPANAVRLSALVAYAPGQWWMPLRGTRKRVKGQPLRGLKSHLHRF